MGHNVVSGPNKVLVLSSDGYLHSTSSYASATSFAGTAIFGDFSGSVSERITSNFELISTNTQLISSLNSSGLISSSIFSSPSQGTLRAVINNVTTNVDLGLQTSDDVAFKNISGSNISASGRLLIKDEDNKGTIFFGSASNVVAIHSPGPSRNSLLSYGNIQVGNEGFISHITASGNISASGRVYGTHFGTGNANRNAIDFSTNNTLQFRLNDGSRITHTTTVFRPTSDEGVSLGRTAEKWKELVVKHITASGNISSSENFEGNSYQIQGKSAITYNSANNRIIYGQNNQNSRLRGATIRLGDDETQHITASGNLSSSGTIIANTGSFNHLKINNNVEVNNDLTVGGTVTAQEFHTEFVSASIIFSSGSTKFGDTLDDVHSMTGSLLVTGSQTIIGGDDAFTIQTAPVGTSLTQFRTINAGGNEQFAVTKDFNKHTDVFINKDGTFKVLLGSYYPTVIGNEHYSTRGGLVLGSDLGIPGTARVHNRYGIYVSAGPDSGSAYFAEHVTFNSHITASGNISSSGGIQVGFGTFSGTTDTKTDAAIVIPEDKAIYTLDSSGAHLRNLIRKDTDVIIVGQSPTSLIDEIRLKPGSSGFTSFYSQSREVARIDIEGNVTASGNISSSGHISASTAVFPNLLDNPTSNTVFYNSDTGQLSFGVAASDFTAVGISGSWRGELSSSVYLQQVSNTISGSYLGELSSSVYLQNVKDIVSGSYLGELSSSVYLQNVKDIISGSVNSAAVTGSWSSQYFNTLTAAGISGSGPSSAAVSGAINFTFGTDAFNTRKIGTGGQTTTLGSGDDILFSGGSAISLELSSSAKTIQVNLDFEKEENLSSFATNERVLVTAPNTAGHTHKKTLVSDFLGNSIVPGGGLQLSLNNPGQNNKLEVDANSVAGHMLSQNTTSAPSNCIIDFDPAGNAGEIVFSGTIDGNNTISAGGASVSGRLLFDGTNLLVAGDIIAFSTSDKRFKNNIKPIKNPIDKILQIGGYTFNWNEKQNTYNGNDIGVIAQEVEKVLPEVVTKRDGGFKAVKYDKIVPLLIEAIKDQQKQIDNLKKLINANI